MSRMLFVNTTATDIPATRSFFSGLGFSFNDDFCDDTTLCLVVNDQSFVMIMTPEKFQGFISGGITDTSKEREVLIAISAESKDAVDTLVDTALATGGSTWQETQDHGWMYGRSFRDLDGHAWEVSWMDLSQFEG
ncbi:VOC family protein [Gordonia soli]|uniref:Glyoxalase/fosfomycin resistance/dioxygenase domain-containing protein n=1 Tax=Gordonia soli NBRC 108243 TaxID=1223545 RepID=M0QRJ0_9ACTN|nr:VOC family protein [Gordonia soli]GAC70956.1 hypothetical protein GS4_45_00120 [Gordonia soli NBRC 108243]